MYPNATLTRFWAKVRKTDGCWLWTGAKAGGRYGTLTANSEQLYAHRFAWEQEHGPIPPGMKVCHRCDIPLCVRAVCHVAGCPHTETAPGCESHLFLGTDADNAADKARKGRANSPTGEKHGNAKLTVAQVRAIRAAYATGTRQAYLARQYGLSRAHVSSLVHGKYWNGAA